MAEQKKTTLPTGFGGSYESYAGDTLSLDKLVTKTPSATYFMRVSGDNAGARIENGDIAVIDRSLDAQSGDIVIAIVDSELVLRRFVYKDNKVLLYREDETPSEIMNKEEFEIWGVVTFTLTNHRENN